MPLNSAFFADSWKTRKLSTEHEQVVPACIVDWYVRLIHICWFVCPFVFVLPHQAGFLASLPFLAMAVTIQLGGYIADVLRMKQIFSTTVVRKGFNTFGKWSFYLCMYQNTLQGRSDFSYCICVGLVCWCVTRKATWRNKRRETSTHKNAHIDTHTHTHNTHTHAHTQRTHTHTHTHTNTHKHTYTDTQRTQDTSYEMICIMI